MKRILIVEDDHEIRDIFKMIFESYGYEVECSDNGESLYNRKANWPDAIILDKQLPGIDGVEACQYIKSQSLSRHVPVILITASVGIAQAAKTAGADDYFEKPFDMQSMLKKVAGLIENNNGRSVL